MNTAMSASSTGFPEQERDRLIEETARAALRASGYRTLADLECEVSDGHITLSGVVTSYFLKQIAQETILQIKFVERVHNAIRVKPRVP